MSMSTAMSAAISMMQQTPNRIGNLAHSGVWPTPPSSSSSPKDKSQDELPTFYSRGGQLCTPVDASLVQGTADQTDDLSLSGSDESDKSSPLIFNHTTVRQILHQFVKKLDPKQPCAFRTAIFEEDFRPRGEARTYKSHVVSFCAPTLKYPDGRELLIYCDMHTRKYHSHWTGPQRDEVGQLVSDATKMQNRVEINSKVEDHAVWNYSVILRAQRRESLLTTDIWTSFEFRMPPKFALVNGVKQAVEPTWIDVQNTARAAVSRWAYKVPSVTPLASIGGGIGGVPQTFEQVNAPQPEILKAPVPQSAKGTAAPPQRPMVISIHDIRQIGMAHGLYPTGNVKSAPTPSVAHQVPRQMGGKLSPEAIRQIANAQCQAPAHPPVLQTAAPINPPANPLMQAYLASIMPHRKVAGPANASNEIPPVHQQERLAAAAAGGFIASSRIQQHQQQPPMATAAGGSVTPYCMQQHQQQQLVATAGGGSVAAYRMQQQRYQQYQQYQKSQQDQQRQQHQQQPLVATAAGGFVAPYRIQQPQRPMFAPNPHLQPQQPSTVFNNGHWGVAGAFHPTSVNMNQFNPNQGLPDPSSALFEYEQRSLRKRAGDGDGQEGPAKRTRM